MFAKDLRPRNDTLQGIRNGAPDRLSRCSAGASDCHSAAENRARQRFPRIRSAPRGVDPRAPSAELLALIEAPAGCCHASQTRRLDRLKYAPFTPILCRVSAYVPPRNRSDSYRQHDSGTQDVNDPSGAHVPCSGVRHGVVHVLGSVSALIGPPVKGGTEGRPIWQALRWRKSLQTERFPRDLRAHDSVRRLLVIKRRRG